MDEIVAADLEIDAQKPMTKVEADALKVLRDTAEAARHSPAAKQARAFQETVDATTTPLVVYDCVYLQTFLAPRDTWLPQPSSTDGRAAIGFFVLPPSSVFTRGPTST